MRRRLIKFIVFPAILISAALGAEEEIAGEQKETCLALYEQFESELKKASRFYSDATTGKHIPIEDLSILYGPGEPTAYRVEGAYLLHLWADNSNIRFRRLVNLPLKRLLGSAIFQPTAPTFTVAKAVLEARGYLDAFGINIPPDDFKLSFVTFYENYHSCWQVGWKRLTDGYPCHDFLRGEYIGVSFHETHGLRSMGNFVYSPPPRSTEVEVKREDAIVKASKYVPLVQKTAFYQRTRMDGFVTSAVKSCELKVVVPNWLFDPERAVWLPESPPTETRLCWVVEFKTRDAKIAQRGIKGILIPPDIIIYLDAKAREVVGADFT